MTQPAAGPPVRVVGSTNFDLVIQSHHLPGPAETVLGGEYRTVPGGKGANQAVGLHRLGSPVCFLSRVGKDHYGLQFLDHLRAVGIDPSHVIQDEELPTGLALITQDQIGTRSIVVAPGANQRLSENDVEDYLTDCGEGGLLVTQLEIPARTVHHLLRLAKRHDLRTVLHASPVLDDFPIEALRMVDLLVLNQSELRALSGQSAQHLETAATAAKRLLEHGCGAVLVTMGVRGVLVVQREGTEFVPGIKVSIVDSNVGSSAFIAGLVHHIGQSGDDAFREPTALHESVRFGLGAMALALSRAGGQSSLPSAAEVEAFLHSVDDEPPSRGDLAADKLRDLSTHANSIRRRIIRMLYAARSGHPGGSLSLVEVLTALYFHSMVYNPRRPDWDERDRLVLSKGHAAPALYSTLIEAGFLDASLETELRKLGSPLQGHPDARKCAGVEMSTGSLGQGLSAANGMALATRQLRRNFRVYAILGDGEVQEGQIWEAAMSAAHYRLDNLCAILDYNALQIDGSISQVKSPIEPLADKWKSFGWNVINVDGHDLEELCCAFDRAREVSGQPTIVIAHTIKGRGVSFMEGVIEYHGSTLNEDEVERALAELEAEGCS